MAITFPRPYSRKMGVPRGRQRSIINLIFEISRMFRALWEPFVSAGDINLSDNVLGNAVSEAQKSHSFRGYTVNGKNAERNAEIIGRVRVRVQKWRDYIAHILYFARAYKYIVSLDTSVALLSLLLRRS